MIGSVMKLKDILLISMIFLLIFTIGAVNASEEIASDDFSAGLCDLAVQEYSVDDAGDIGDNVICDDSNQEVPNLNEDIPSQEIQDKNGEDMTVESIRCQPNG